MRSGATIGLRKADRRAKKARESIPDRYWAAITANPAQNTLRKVEEDYFLARGLTRSLSYTQSGGSFSKAIGNQSRKLSRLQPLPRASEF